METKWYSNGLTAEEAQKLRKEYAKIEKPSYGVNDREVLALQFSLRYESGMGTYWELTDPKDIKALLTATKAFEVSELEGKIVEAFIDTSTLNGLGVLRGLSVNENLI